MIKVNFRGIINNGPKQESIARLACKELENALNHPSFAERVMGARYTETKFEDQNGRSFSVPPRDIYSYIASGAEMNTARDSTIDIEVSLEDRSDVGGTYPGKLPFYTAFWFINGCIENNNDYISLASHFIHEWLHVSGFYHFPDNSARDDVPYLVQQIVSDILRESAKSSPTSSFNKSASAFKNKVLAPMEKQLLAADCGAQNRSDDAFVRTDTESSDDLIM